MGQIVEEDGRQMDRVGSGQVGSGCIKVGPEQLSKGQDSGNIV